MFDFIGAPLRLVSERSIPETSVEGGFLEASKPEQYLNPNVF